MSKPEELETFKQLGDRTWVWLGDLDRHEQTNVGVITDERSIIVIDANFEWAAKRIAPAIANTFDLPVRHVVNTHYHVDHSLGNGVFAATGATIVGGQGQRAELLAKGPDDARIQIGEVPEEFCPAELEFNGTITFPYSGLTLFATEPAHTASDVVAWIPDDAVVFVGDLAVAWLHGNNLSDDDADIDGWLAALTRCLALHPRIVVPAHGRLGGPEILIKQRDFIQELWDWSRATAAEGHHEPSAEVAEGFVARHPDFAVSTKRLTEMARSTLRAARRQLSR